LRESGPAPRAQIILALAGGATSTQVARRLEVDPSTVSKWKRRFIDQRTAGLSDRPRPGAPRRATADLEERVVRASRSAESRGGRSTRSLADEFGISQSTVSRILRTSNGLVLRKSPAVGSGHIPRSSPQARSAERRRHQGRRRRGDVRQLLLEAAERVTAREGRAATLRSIAQEAGVARSVLYQHFSSRQQLLTEAAVSPFNDFLDSFRELSLAQLKDQRRSTWEMEIEYTSGVLDHFTRHRHFFETVLSDRTALSEAISSALLGTLHDVIEELVAVGVSEVEAHRPHIPIETVGAKVRLTTALVIGVITSQHWLLPRGADAWSRDELIKHLSAFSLYGVQNAPAAGSVEAWP
jgi:AcrR family transcriptional regulator/DNA-binding CsgD family transcriptional regulator